MGDRLSKQFSHSSGAVNTGISYGSDTQENRAIALDKLIWINGDIRNDRLDISLDRYQPKSNQQAYLKVVADSLAQITLIEFWDSYLNYLKPTRKDSTLQYLDVNVTSYIRRCPITSPYSALEVRAWLLAHTTPSMTKRVLIQLNAAFKWALKHKKLTGSISPFEGMASEFKHKYEQETQPNAFTLNERDRVIEAFQSHQAKGYSYQCYAPLVEFMFLTGCRPNEAIGLQWIDIDPNYRFILFNGGITCVGGKQISSQGEGSKSKNKMRKFPINERLRELLQSLPRTSKLVFPSPRNKPIHYNNFSRRAWDTIVDPIKPDTTPYSCRDTFITEQIAKGVSAPIIAKWVDNSVRMIEKHYLDMASIDHILPQ